jgi:hypothetical protein
MSKLDEYRDFDVLDFLVVVDLVFFMGLDLGEGEKLDGLGLRIEEKEGLIMVRGTALVMISECWDKGTEGFSMMLGVVVVVFDGEDFCGEVLVGEV